MRAFVSTLILCACVFLLSPAVQARSIGVPAGIPAQGLIHMLKSMRHGGTHRHVAMRRVHYRHRIARVRHVRRERMVSLKPVMLPFEPGPFSMMFGAAQGVVDDGVGIVGFGTSLASNVAVGVASHVAEGVSRVIGYRPRDCAGIPWCGCFLRHIVGRDPGPAYNLARNWAHWGHPTFPHVGAIVVWPHHVGRIVAQSRNGEWIVLSGNDGHAVRARSRSLAGAIAFRE